LVDRLREKIQERLTCRLRKPTTLSKLANTSVVHEAERGCWLAQPTGSIEAPGATG
jgi:hypothetical protein